MSVIVTVGAAGVITLAAPVFSALVTAAAATLGMRVLNQAQAAAEEEARAKAEARASPRVEGQEISVTSATEAAITQVVAERCSLSFTDGDVELTVLRDIRGKVTVRAHAHALTRAQLTERAERLLGLIRQQVAYREVVTKLKAHGLAVETEAREADGTVRVRLARR